MNDGWKAVEIEPEAVEVNGNGHSDESPEPPQTLFSWAEFMAEEPGEAEGPQAQGSARHPLDVRVGR